MHIVVLLLVAKFIKAPFFFVAVGSQANVGGAAQRRLWRVRSPLPWLLWACCSLCWVMQGNIGAIVCMEWMHALSM